MINIHFVLYAGGVIVTLDPNVRNVWCGQRKTLVNLKHRKVLESKRHRKKRRKGQSRLLVYFI